MFKETEIKMEDFSNTGICKKESNGNSRTDKYDIWN